MIVNSKYTDVDVDFSKNPFTNDLAVVRDLNAIQQSVISIVLTSPHEKPFHKDYGVGIYDLLFENIEPEDIGIIAADIERQLRKYDNRVRFDEVIIDQTDFLLEIELKYFVLLGSRNEPVLQVVKLTLTRIR